MTQNHRVFVLLACLAALLCQTQGRADGPFDSLLQRLPSETNAVLAIDVKGIMDSPLARQERWADKRRDDYLARVSTLPANTRRLVVGAQLDPSTMQNVFKIGIAQVPGKWPIAKLSQQIGGQIDKIDNKDVVLTRQGYAFVVGPSMLGGMQPANRQAFSRWSRFASRSTRVVLSRPLREALARLDEDHQVVMALDATDMFDMAGIQQRLEKVKGGIPSNVDLVHLAALISGLRSITLTMGVQDSIKGQIRLQFTRPVDIPADLGKSLVLRALDNLGAHVDDLDGWKATIKGDELILSGKLTRQAARELMSPLDPSSTASQAAALSNEPPESKDPKVIATKRYFNSTRTLLDELKSQKTKVWNKLAYWYDECAKRIDELPILNVDPDALAYGASVSQTLRGLSQAAYNTGRGIQYTRNQVSMQAVDFGGAYYGGYATNRFGNTRGYSYYQPNVGVVSNMQQVSNLMSQSANSYAALRAETWANIDKATGDLRRKLVEKYHAEF